MPTPASSARAAAVALGAAALVLTAAGAAHAAGASHRDATGDAPTAASDITRVVVKNGEKTLMVQAKLLRASVARTHVVVTLTPAAEGAATYVVRTVEVGHRVGATLESTAVGATGATPVECSGVKAAVSRGKRGMVHVRVPQSCFGEDAGSLVAEVATQTTAQVETETPAEEESGVEDTADETTPVEVEQG
jgi:hypothetical protein